MTERFAEKTEARRYARERAVSYRTALAVVRERHAAEPVDWSPFVHRLLIEAVEGCGIRHWARVRSWNGVDVAVITDLSGDSYELNRDLLADVLGERRAEQRLSRPLDIDSYVADELVQRALFGGTLYLSGIRGRPV